MTTIVGTCYYASETSAARHYAGDHKAAIKEGRIILGKPPGVAAHALALQEGRYYVLEKKSPNTQNDQ